MSRYSELFLKGESARANRPLAVALVALVLLSILALRDVLILSRGPFHHLFSVINVPAASFDEVFLYAPYVTRFGLHTPLPVAPAFYGDLSGLSFFPFLTLIINGLLFKGLCFSNLDLYLLVGHVLLPMLSFFLILKIFNRYVSLSWSLLLAFWGATFLSRFSAFGYWAQCLRDPSQAVALASVVPPEISRMPFPSLSLLVFLATFWISTQAYWEKRSHLLGMTALWALNYYVYLFNFVAGILFWFGYLLACQYFRKRSPAKAIADLLLCAGVVALVLAPALWRFTHLSPVDHEVMSRLGVVGRGAGLVVNPWGITFSYLLPIAATAGVIQLYCADRYELFYRFTPVFLMMVVEILVINLHLVVGEFVQPELFLTRIEPFFPRYFYFLPCIYFFAAPRKTFFHREVRGIDRVADRVHDFFNSTIIRFRAVIAALGIAGIGWIVGMSSLRFYRNHVETVAGPMAPIEAHARALATSRREGPMTVVSEDLPANFLVSLVTPHDALVGSSFNNPVSTEELLERLALYARLFQWKKERFLDFMMPSEEFEELLSGDSFRVTEAFLARGFGYWLVWHRRRMGPEETVRYRERLVGLYDSLDVPAALSKYRVRAIQAFDGVAPALAVRPLGAAGGMRLYAPMGAP
ncbi:MAG: hypothetical protein WC728_05930 [Elusimicrobiota bacterium]